MEQMVNVFLFGKKYEVPASLTIMEAMEYAGYQLVRGCGCRNGFCGACATIYRIAGDRELKACLACSTQVQNNMYVATLPFFPLVKEVYDIEKIKPTQQIMMQLYPEIYSCVGCNACTKVCPAQKCQHDADIVVMNGCVQWRCATQGWCIDVHIIACNKQESHFGVASRSNKMQRRSIVFC